MRSEPKVRALWPLAVVATVAGCGFNARPKSGNVACMPQGTACCPEGYVCVGRGTSTDAGTSPGTCWYKEDLPLSALAAMHDYTPAIANDPACLVTEWLPPVSGTSGGQLDGATPDVEQLPPLGTGGSGGGRDSGPDVPLGQDTYVQLGTDGSGGPADVPAASGPDALLDIAAEAGLPRPVDGAAMDGAAVPLDAPLDLSIAAVPLDAPLDLSIGAEAGAADTGSGRIIASVAAGHSHTCAVINGAAKCWVVNNYGQLGDNTTTDKLHPVQVVGLESGVTAIAADMYFTCAVVNGGAKCWGDNEYGQLGDGTTTPRRRSYPVQVAGLDSGVTAVTTGMSHACALVNGGARCWGGNLLGDGTTTYRTTPVQVVGLESGVTAIDAEMNHTCAAVNGAMKCWGRNTFSVLGDGTTSTALSPVQVVGLESGVSAVSVGEDLSCAVVNGAAKCWGHNDGSDKLGTGVFQNEIAPVQVLGLTSQVTAIASGQYHSCAIIGGGARCWGRSLSGQLGTGDTTSHLGSVQVLGLVSDVTAITVGYDHSCAVVANEVKCWGGNFAGALGDGTMDPKSYPVLVGL